MRRRWPLAVATSALVVLIASGCNTMVEISAPQGPNHAGSSVPEAQGGGPVLSGDGRYSVFTAPRDSGSTTLEAFRRDAATGRTVRVSSDAAGHAVGGDVPVISRDGRFVVFRTAATLVAGDHNLDPTRGLTGFDWYLKDMKTGAFELLSFDEHGTQLAPGGPDSLTPTAYVSASGRYVAFQLIHAQASLFDSEIYLRDRQAGVTHRVDGGYRMLAGLSGDGLHVGVDDFDPCQTFCPPPYPGVHIDDWSAGTSYTIGCGAGGRTPMSDDGRLIAVTQVNQDEGCQLGLARYDRTRSAPPVMFTPVLPIAEGGGAPQLTSASMSVDGNRAAFTLDRDLAPGDVNEQVDVYVSDLVGRSFRDASRPSSGQDADGPSANPWLSPDGSVVQFDTTATNIVAADTDGASDTVVGPAVRPSLHRVASPPRVQPGGSVDIDAVGTGIAPNAFVLIAGGDVTVSNVVVVSPTEVRYRVTVAPSAATGYRGATVVNPGRYGIVASGNIPAAIAVFVPPPP